ncbi:hypothetical protein [Moheibacter sediminis]|uniref:Uncharacterized protein n=1 Tax=Moheibacter sediminis TaxID=1434700 RepID=A0A1W2AD05_9FLAO|nr:hypothetical protein [Moheibacter sediminis]SMC58605.1 hypothetical protein SAMN06296427_10471 [Moheibacter sediminis]
MKIKTLKYILCAFFFTVYTFPVIADPNSPDAGDDPQAASIDHYIILLFSAAVLMGARYFIQPKKH